MIKKFGGLAIGDRVKHVKDEAIGTVILFDSEWLRCNLEAETFDVGVIWDEDWEDLPSRIEIDWQSSSKLEKIVHPVPLSE